MGEEGRDSRGYGISPLCGTVSPEYGIAKSELNGLLSLSPFLHSPGKLQKKKTIKQQKREKRTVWMKETDDMLA